MSEKNPELKRVVDMGIDVVALGLAVEKNGKQYASDVPAAIKVFDDFGPAMSGAKAGVSELKSLSAEDAEDLVAYVAAKLALDSAKAQAIAASALKAGAANYELYLAIKG